MLPAATRNHHWTELETEPRGGKVKRAFDLGIASIALILLSPLMFIVAVTILLREGAPIFYSHPRVGFGGKQFQCFKFRTMCTNSDEMLEKLLRSNPDASSEWRETQKLRADPRVSALGQVLRRTSIDELPQLFNVLRGEMSCVGPRPITRAEGARYGARYHYYLKTRPGLTGAWQVNGRSDTSYDNRVALDAEYVRRWSLTKDIIILLRTIVVLINKRGSC